MNIRSIVLGYIGLSIALGSCTVMMPITAGQGVVFPEMQENPADLSVFLPFPPPIPVRKKNTQPFIQAKAALAIDFDSGTILYQKNIRASLPIASLTKLMTSIVAIEAIADLEESVAVPPEVRTIEPSKMNLIPGDRISFRDLIRGALIHSANDAAYVLAYSIKDLVQRMNAKARELMLNDTEFSNTIGWDEEKNYSSAFDLMKIMRYALTKPLIQNSIGITNLTVTSSRGNSYRLENTNKLLSSFLTEVGGKTGTTDLAGACLINMFKNPDGNRILTVVLNSPDRFQESKVLANWTLENFEWR